MEIFNIDLVTNLEVRTIQRGEDIDLFIQTLGIPIHLEIQDSSYSRIQFPQVRAVLIRMSPTNSAITCHILRDIDLFSSFANFEVHKPLKEIVLYKQDSYIDLKFN
ncbi:hypothetical protein [Cellulosilyticum sp. I15G10I2]|uniref:hypothetical protein n=1 Tax=Cellulosilyticum sp. I15G10I2 TaxID=1892843 RepID=UPI00085C1F61|nr:hypothetical protein [Cellulosilyticum sp. I15G10I2]